MLAAFLMSAASRAQSGAAQEDPALRHAEALIEQGQRADAEAALRSYVASHADSAKAHVLLGLVLYQQDRPADSLAEFSQAAKLKKPRASELVVVALDYVKLRDLKNADKWITESVQMAPGDAAAWRYMGGIKYSENRMAEAIGAYEHCLKLLPKDVLSEDGIGRAYEGLGRNKDAEAAYRTALEWQASAKKKYLQPLLHLGGLLVEEGQARAGLPYLIAAKSLAPKDVDVCEQLGEAYESLKEYASAQGELEEAVRLAPGNSRLHWLLAEVYRKEGLMKKAQAEMRKFAEMVGSHSNKAAP